MYFVHESKWFLSDFCYSHFKKMKQCSWSKVQNRLLPSLFFFIFFFNFYFFFLQFSRKVMYIYVFKKRKSCVYLVTCVYSLDTWFICPLYAWSAKKIFCKYLILHVKHILTWQCSRTKFYFFISENRGFFLSLSHCILDTGVYFIIQNNRILYDMM